MASLSEGERDCELGKLRTREMAREKEKVDSFVSSLEELVKATENLTVLLQRLAN